MSSVDNSKKLWEYMAKKEVRTGNIENNQEQQDDPTSKIKKFEDTTKKEKNHIVPRKTIKEGSISEVNTAKLNLVQHLMENQTHSSHF